MCLSSPSPLLNSFGVDRSRLEDTRLICAPTCPSQEAVPRETSVPMPTQRRRERSEWEEGQVEKWSGRVEMEGRGRNGHVVSD